LFEILGGMLVGTNETGLGGGVDVSEDKALII
jgi:hypothetical protein